MREQSAVREFNRSDILKTWAFVAAGGAGRRMAAGVPKQYLALGGREILRHAIERLASHPAIDGVVVGISEADPHFSRLADLPVCAVTRAGAERADTVLAGLGAMTSFADDADWVMVHDAARPLLRHRDIDSLLAARGGDGALLAMPLTDTVKFADAHGRVERTVDRSRLWRAATPQLFPLGTLRDALAAAIAAGVEVTDEAAAMERAGFRPALVSCGPDNIKITSPGDLPLAEWLLERQENER